MTRDVIVARPYTPVHEVAMLLEKNRIKRVPVVEDDRLVGIISRANLIQAVASSREEPGRASIGHRDPRQICSLT